MPASQDPEKRARQLANLRSSAAVTHGAHSGELIRQATAEHVANLSRTLPSATGEEIAVQASRMAMIERLVAYVEARGLIADARKGTVHHAADSWRSSPRVRAPTPDPARARAGAG